MRPSKALTTCAVSALAMVFSVQQGEHGPLVVYKLAVPQSAGPVVPAPAPLAVPATPTTTVVIEDPDAAARNGRRLSPLQPTILGTVVMPAGRAVPPPSLAAPPPAHAATFGGMPLQTPAADSPGVPDSATVYRIIEETQDSGRMINEETGGTLTLKQVSDAVAWRRDTAEKLRQVPIAPRF